jgi:hypothetical protein
MGVGGHQRSILRSLHLAPNNGLYTRIAPSMSVFSINLSTVPKTAATPAKWQLVNRLQPQQHLAINPAGCSCQLMPRKEERDAHTLHAGKTTCSVMQNHSTLPAFVQRQAKVPAC